MEVAEVQRPFPRVDFSRFLRLPVILGIEALISGRMLHESCPLWFQVALWTFFAVPLFIPDSKLLVYYRLLFVYCMHSLLNLVDSFLLNLPRPEIRPIWGLIGITSMELPDFQYLVRIAFMLFNLLFFRGVFSNILIPEEDRKWTLGKLPSIAVPAILIFSNFAFVGRVILFGLRLSSLLHTLRPLVQHLYDFWFDETLRGEIAQRTREEKSVIKALLKMGFERLCLVNPSATVILQILFKAMIVKAFLHCIATFLQLSIKIEPLTQMSPPIEDISINAINSTGVALLNMTSFALESFAQMNYFEGFSIGSTISSSILIQTDSLCSVFAVAYFLTGPGEYAGVAIQRWLVNGQEPHDPEERGARMGQFLSMLHGFMALQTGITYMDPPSRLDRAEKNSWLILVACFHYLHEMVDAELTNNPDVRAVHRPMQAMIGLFIIPVMIEVELILHHEISTWWIPVFVFTLELIIKTSTSFMVWYMLKHDWNEDWIFWTKTGSKFCELIGGCIMLGNAIYVLIYQRPIMLCIRVIMMLIHTYFNIYQTFKKGYSKIRLRIQTSQKLDSLKTVNVEEIPEPDRLCAICYEDFEVGINANPVIETECQHRFHRMCIKKWLRLKNVCPLCHRPVFKEDKPTQDEEAEHADDIINQNAMLFDDDFDDDLDF